MPDALPRRFFRIIDSNHPKSSDFMSNQERGIEPQRPLTRRERDRWQGVSHMATRNAAALRIRVSPWLGSYVAEIVIPPDANVRIEQTTRDAAHYTIWADAADLLSWVVAVWHL